MAIDDAEKRRTASGLNILSPAVTPNAATDEEWRAQSGHGYRNLAPFVPVLSSGSSVTRGMYGRMFGRV